MKGKKVNLEETRKKYFGLLRPEKRLKGFRVKEHEPVVKLDKVAMLIKTNNKFGDITINDDYSKMSYFMLNKFEKYLKIFRNPLYKYNYVITKNDIETLHVSFSPEFSDPREVSHGFRIEFNPCVKTMKLLKYFLSEMIGHFHVIEFKDFIKFNRLDIAIDYPVEINPSLISVSGKQKGFFVSGSRGLESVYFGSRNSEFYLRIYNKKKELFQKDKIQYLGNHLWRFELELKKEMYFDRSFEVVEDFFSRVFVFGNSGMKTGDWKLDLILFKASTVQSIDPVLKELPKNTRTTYRKKLKKYELIKVKKPVEVYNEKFPVLWNEFRNEIKNCFALEQAVFQAG